MVSLRRQVDVSCANYGRLLKSARIQSNLKDRFHKQDIVQQPPLTRFQLASNRVTVLLKEQLKSSSCKTMLSLSN